MRTNRDTDEIEKFRLFLVENQKFMKASSFTDVEPSKMTRMMKGYPMDWYSKTMIQRKIESFILAYCNSFDFWPEKQNSGL